MWHLRTLRATQSCSNSESAAALNQTLSGAVRRTVVAKFLRGERKVPTPFKEGLGGIPTSGGQGSSPGGVRGGDPRKFKEFFVFVLKETFKTSKLSQMT